MCGSISLRDNRERFPWEEWNTIPDDRPRKSDNVFIGHYNHCIVWPGNVTGVKVSNFMPGIDRIIFNNPATIVYWKDGTKTVVKAHDEEFSEEHGLAMAFARKVLETSYLNENPRAGFKRLVRDATRY